MSETIQIVEVGPRDGLQNEAAVLEPAVRAEFVRRLEDCGVTRIEAASFVNPKRVPQMAGAEEIMAELPHEAGRSRIGLALNRRGWDRAVAAGCDEANVVVCATDGFGIRNQGAGVAEQLAALADIVAARREGGARRSPSRSAWPSAAPSTARSRRTKSPPSSARAPSSGSARSPWPTPSGSPIPGR